MIKGHPSPTGFDLVGACFGLVQLDAIVTGDRIEPGDAIIGVPSSGLHSNGYTLARRALPDLDEPFERRHASATRCSSRRASTCARWSSCCGPTSTCAGLRTSPATAS